MNDNRSMLHVVEFKDEHSQLWDSYVENSQTATISHLQGWRNVIQKNLSHSPRYLLAIENGTTRGVLPLFLVRTWWRSSYLISIPWLDYGGICADDKESEIKLLDAAQKIAKKEHASFVELRSQTANLDNTVHRKDKVTFLFDLKQEENAIWKGFNGKLRNQIRKSQKSNLTVDFGGKELLDDFYRIFARNMRDLGTPVWGRSLFEDSLIILPENSEIIVVRKDGLAIAGGLVLSFKDKIYVPSASSYRSARAFCPNHALYWEVIKLGIRRGLRYFDFGRSSIDGPTYNFKKQWVPNPTQLVWQYCLSEGQELPSINPSNPKYKLMIKLWQKLPLKLANILGPKVIKNFP